MHSLVATSTPSRHHDLLRNVLLQSTLFSCHTLLGSVLRCRAGKDSSKWVNQTGGGEGSPVSPPSFRSSHVDETKDVIKKEGKKEGMKEVKKDLFQKGSEEGLKGVSKGVSPLPGMLPAHHQVWVLIPAKMYQVISTMCSHRFHRCG